MHLLLSRFVRIQLRLHDGVIKWKHSPRYWPFVRGIHRSPVNSPHKGQRSGILMFTLICTWINGWVKQWWRWWFETPSRPFWRHCNDTSTYMDKYTSDILYGWLSARLWNIELEIHRLALNPQYKLHRDSLPVSSLSAAGHSWLAAR